MTARRGVVSVAVLLLIVAAFPAAVNSGIEARTAALGVRNREALIRAEWEAEGCLARLRAAADAVFEGELRGEVRTTDFRLRFPEAVSSHSLLHSCSSRVMLVPSDSLVDLNGASTATLARLFAGLGSATVQADSLAAAVVDWRDSDDNPGPLGAERAWYVSRVMQAPRNGPFAHLREIALVRGMHAALDLDTPSSWHRIETVLSVERSAGRSEDRGGVPRPDGGARGGQWEGYPAWWLVRIAAGTPPLDVTLGARLIRAQDGFIVRDVWTEP